MNEDLEVVLERLMKRGFVIGNRLGLGNVVSTIFRAERAGHRYVVKIGLSPRAAKEVLANRAGYEEMERIGAGALVPETILSEDVGNVPIIIMSDCGLDFVHATHEAADPSALYEQLVRGMDPIYRRTLTSDPRIGLGSLVERLSLQYTEHLAPFVDGRFVAMLAEDNLGSHRFPAVCFSTFDFTPEDVFVEAGVVKKADPVLPLLGIPVIDLACFAGVALDGRHLPGAEQGYAILKDYATTELPRILGIKPRMAEALFAFGRALQSALSARFRKADHGVASLLSLQSQEFLADYFRIKGGLA